LAGHPLGVVGVSQTDDCPAPSNVGARGNWATRIEAELCYVVPLTLKISNNCLEADHSPPHCHATYGEYEAIIDVRLGSVLRGWLSSGALTLTLVRVGLHRDELLENWSLCATRRQPNKIAPLQ
jgi:hypothetical protein